MTGPAEIITGPCEPWTDGTAVAECCPDLADTDLTLLEQAAEEASGLLFELSGRRYTGLCELTVQAPERPLGCFQVLSRGHVVGQLPADWRLGRTVLKLPGYPVRQILQVIEDGAALDASGYRLDRSQLLVRLDANGDRQVWSADTQVTYLYGEDAPLSGVLAAAQLACELARACPGVGGGGECDLPPNTVRVTRQGLTVDVQTVGLWLASGNTGLAHVDAFLTAYGTPARRRPVFWSPENAPFAKPVG